MVPYRSLLDAVQHSYDPIHMCTKQQQASKLFLQETCAEHTRLLMWGAPSTTNYL